MQASFLHYSKRLHAAVAILTAVLVLGMSITGSFCPRKAAAADRQQSEEIVSALASSAYEEAAPAEACASFSTAALTPSPLAPHQESVRSPDPGAAVTAAPPASNRLHVRLLSPLSLATQTASSAELLRSVVLLL